MILTVWYYMMTYYNLASAQAGFIDKAPLIGLVRWICLPIPPKQPRGPYKQA